MGTPQGKETFHCLAKISHGVFNNLRRDVPARLVLTYEALRSTTPSAAEKQCGADFHSGEIFAEKTNAAWLPILAAKVPCAPVRGIAEALYDPLLAANMIMEYEHPVFGKVREAGCPIKVSDAAPTHCPAPTLGQDTEEVLSGHLGCSLQQIVELRSRGVV